MARTATTTTTTTTAVTTTTEENTAPETQRQQQQLYFCASKYLYSNWFLCCCYCHSFQCEIVFVKRSCTLYNIVLFVSATMNATIYYERVHNLNISFFLHRQKLKKISPQHWLWSYAFFAHYIVVVGSALFGMVKMLLTLQLYKLPVVYASAC